MSEAFVPQPGALVWVDLNPRVGREQSGRRPALVISPLSLWTVTRFVILCPITSRVRPFGTSVVLPPGLAIEGEVLTSHVRSIDTLARPLTSAHGTVPHAVLAEVRAKLAVLTGYD